VDVEHAENDLGFGPDPGKTFDAQVAEEGLFLSRLNLFADLHEFLEAIHGEQVDKLLGGILSISVEDKFKLTEYLENQVNPLIVFKFDSLTFKDYISQMLNNLQIDVSDKLNIKESVSEYIFELIN
jgi:hypothetical protein